MAEQNRALAIRWFEEVWNQGKESTIDELFAVDGHCYGFPDPESDLIGPAAFKEIHRKFLSTFSNINIVIEDVIVEGDRVAIRWTSRMTHDGAGLGFPASGKKVVLGGTSFVDIRNGQIAAGWNHMDFTRLAMQLQSAAA